jgi:hypothetical protein
MDPLRFLVYNRQLDLGRRYVSKQLKRVISLSNLEPMLDSSNLNDNTDANISFEELESIKKKYLEEDFNTMQNEEDD